MPRQTRSQNAIDRARYWRDDALGGVELLRARFVHHTFAPHTHEGYAIGAVPFGLIFGVTVNAARLETVPALGTSVIIFAGSSQLVFASLFGEGAPWLTIIVTAAVLNLRHVLYSASIAPYLRSFSASWKIVLSYLLTDEAYAVAIGHFQTEVANGADFTRRRKNWYFLGVGLTLWGTWLASTTVGVLAGGQIPDAWALDFSVPLTFIAIVVPALRDRAGIAAAIVAGIVSVAAYAMPLRLGLVTATLLGIAAGLLAERILARGHTAEARS